MVYNKDVREAMKQIRRYAGYYALRWKILQRDNFTCQYCGQKAPNVRLEIDHIKPVSEGGLLNEDNLITSCYACNRGKEALSIIVCRKGKANPYIQQSPYLYLSPRQDEALQFLASGNGASPTEIAKNLNITRWNADTVIFRLKRKHLIIKGNDSKWRIVQQSNDGIF